jgi:dienelactone hydrolase
LVDSADEATETIRESGGRVVAGPNDIPVGRPAVVADPFGNLLAELTAAERLRAAGHRVVAPDLLSGAVAGHGGAPTVEDGFALMEDVGWNAIVGRACAAVRDLPAPTTVPGGVRPGTPVQVHVAVTDPFATADQIVAHQDSAARAGAEAALFTYPGAGHFFTDAESPAYDRTAADAAGGAWGMAPLYHR